MMTTNKDILQDDFLKSLIQKTQTLEDPSVDFTQRVMQQALAQKVQSARTQKHKVWLKYITMLAFGLSSVAILLFFIYIVFPYISVWLPDFQTILHSISTYELIAERLFRAYFMDAMKISLLGAAVLFTAIAWQSFRYRRAISN